MISLVRGTVERLRPPRALHCEFPLGRPLGRPGDPAFQRSVLDAAFGLLARPAGPVLEVFPEQITDEGDVPVSCAVPPQVSGGPPAAQEARAYRPSYDRQLARSGRTLLGRAIGPDQVPAVVAGLAAVAGGESWAAAGLPPAAPADVAMDVRAYYEEAALALSSAAPGARSVEAWLFRQTLTGRLLLDVQSALRERGEPRDVWLGVAPRGYP